MIIAFYAAATGRHHHHQTIFRRAYLRVRIQTGRRRAAGVTLRWIASMMGDVRIGCETALSVFIGNIKNLWFMTLFVHIMLMAQARDEVYRDCGGVWPPRRNSYFFLSSFSEHQNIYMSKNLYLKPAIRRGSECADSPSTKPKLLIKDAMNTKSSISRSRVKVW